MPEKVTKGIKISFHHLSSYQYNRQSYIYYPFSYPFSTKFISMCMSQKKHYNKPTLYYFYCCWMSLRVNFQWRNFHFAFFSPFKLYLHFYIYIIFWIILKRTTNMECSLIKKLYENSMIAGSFSYKVNPIICTLINIYI